MGLAASQARLLTITSRISNNELRQQRIAMDKMRLASDQDSVSTKYSEALNNKTLSFINGANSIPMTYDELLSRGYSVARASDGVVAKDGASVNAENNSAKNTSLSDPEVQKWVGKEAPQRPTFNETPPTQPSQRLTEPSKTIQTSGSVTVPDFSAQLNLAQECANSSYNWNVNSWDSGGMQNSIEQSRSKSLKNSLSNSLQGLINNLYSAGLTSTAYYIESRKESAELVYQKAYALNDTFVGGNYGQTSGVFGMGSYKTPENEYGQTMLRVLQSQQTAAQQEASNMGPVNTTATNPNYQTELNAYNANKTEWDNYNTKKAEYDAKLSEYESQVAQFNTDYNNWKLANPSAADTASDAKSSSVDISSASSDLAAQLRQSPNFLIQGLLSGYLVLMKDGQQVSMTSATDIEESYDKSDDAAAESEYNSEMAKINRKEKLLDMQAKRLDTEYSSLTTELESIKSIISSHASKDFSYFTG